MDHICFPHLFCSGKGDDRKVQITPSMFAKWILKQKNGKARREIPYLFSLALRISKNAKNKRNFVFYYSYSNFHLNIMTNILHYTVLIVVALFFTVEVHTFLLQNVLLLVKFF
jgi:hypothetical protein